MGRLRSAAGAIAALLLVACTSGQPTAPAKTAAPSSSGSARPTSSAGPFRTVTTGSLDPYVVLGLSPRQVRLLHNIGIALGAPPAVVRIRITRAVAARLFAADFPSGPGAAPPEKGFLTDFKALRKFMTPPVGRYVACWAFKLANPGPGTGLASVAPRSVRRTWLVVFINAITGAVQGGFVG